MVIVQVAFLQGCGGNVALNKDKFSNVKEIKAAYYKTRDIKMFSTSRNVAGICISPLLCISPLVAIKTAPEVKGPLDFGKLVLKNFTEYANKNVATWPKTEVVEYYIPENYRDYRDTLLTIKLLDEPRIGTALGFRAVTIIELESRDGSIIWREFFNYHSGIFNSKRKEALQKIADRSEILSQDDIVLISEEMEYAAKVTAAGFIKALTAEKVIINVVDDAPDRSLKPTSEPKEVTK